jgi:hypothetical protein
MKAQLTLALALLLTSAGAALAQSPDGQTPAEETVCDHESGAAFTGRTLRHPSARREGGRRGARPRLLERVERPMPVVTQAGPFVVNGRKETPRRRWTREDCGNGLGRLYSEPGGRQRPGFSRM